MSCDGVTEPPEVTGHARGGPKALSFAPTDGGLELVKWIALVLMVVDHAGALVFDLGKFSWAYHAGRIAFPLFAFTLGCKLARKAGANASPDLRTVRRLALWTLVSVVPHLLATGRLWPLSVMTTLCLGALACWLAQSPARWLTRKRWRWPAASALFAATMACDYFAAGAGLVLAVFLFYRKPAVASASLVALCLAGVAFLNWSLWTLAALPIALVAHWYNPPIARAKNFFYAFYPVHLLVLAGIARAVTR